MLTAEAGREKAVAFKNTDISSCETVSVPITVPVRV